MEANRMSELFEKMAKELIAGNEAEVKKLTQEAIDGGAVARDVLVKVKQTEPQTGLIRKKRLINVKNAFSIKDSSKIAGKNVLLVDDVYTTGATANECSKVLLNVGAGRVDVLTLARAL